MSAVDVKSTTNSSVNNTKSTTNTTAVTDTKSLQLTTPKASLYDEIMLIIKCLTGKTEIYKVHGQLTWGQFWMMVLEGTREDDKGIIFCGKYIVSSNKGDSINISYHLNDKLSEYVIDKSIIVHCVQLEPTTVTLDPGYKRWVEGKPWPPCDNYGKEEPLNMLPFGTRSMEGHTCIRCSGRNYNRAHDNSDRHMIVLLYPNSKARIGYNKYMLIEWIISQLDQGKLPTDPQSRLPYSQANITTIVEGGDYSEVQLQ